MKLLSPNKANIILALLLSFFFNPYIGVYEKGNSTTDNYLTLFQYLFTPAPAGEASFEVVGLLTGFIIAYIFAAVVVHFLLPQLTKKYKKK